MRTLAIGAIVVAALARGAAIRIVVEGDDDE